MAGSALDTQLLNLLIAAMGDDPERAPRVRALVAQGASVHAVSADRTPLHWAARAGDVDCVTALLELGADPNRAGGQGQTPLHEAVWGGPTDPAARACVRTLLAGGARATEANAEGALPLHLAAERGLLGALGELGPASPLDQPTRAGRTALELALVHRRWPAVQRLLRLGAKVDEASLARAPQAPAHLRALLEAARGGQPLLEGPFSDFAAQLMEHLDDGPAMDAQLQPEEVRALLERLAGQLGLGVARGLDANSDVDHFQDEYGDAWLGELLASYWLDAHAPTLEQTWNALPEAARGRLPMLETLVAAWEERYREAALAHLGAEPTPGDLEDDA